MSLNWTELQAVRERVARLTPGEQLLVAEEILRTVRKAHLTDRPADGAARAEMAEDLEALAAHERSPRPAGRPLPEAARVAG